METQREVQTSLGRRRTWLAKRGKERPIDPSPAAPTTSNVRGTLISSTFVLTSTPDGLGTYVTGDVDCDPRGSVPNWIVNFFQKDWPHDTLMSLRKQVAKSNIVENPAIRKLVTPPAQSAQ